MNERNVEALAALLREMYEYDASGDDAFDGSAEAEARWLIARGVSVAAAGEPTGPDIARALAHLQQASVDTGESGFDHSLTHSYVVRAIELLTPRLAGDGAPSGEGPSGLASPDALIEQGLDEHARAADDAADRSRAQGEP